RWHHEHRAGSRTAESASRAGDRGRHRLAPRLATTKRVDVDGGEARGRHSESLAYGSAPAARRLASCAAAAKADSVEDIIDSHRNHRALEPAFESGRVSAGGDPIPVRFRDNESAGPEDRDQCGGLALHDADGLTLHDADGLTLHDADGLTLHDAD